ncbi:MAG: hypothetical protein U0176_05030 [Bacteroidia bacterium]
MQDPRYAGHGVKVQRAYGHAMMLHTLHEHNLRLLQQELDFWENKERNPAEAAEYCEYLKGILGRAAKFNPENEALVRVGFATGWTSITGGWQESCMGYGDFDKLMEGSRKRGRLALSQDPQARQTLYPLRLPLLAACGGRQAAFPEGTSAKG